jgi:hypothetical protein
MNGEKVGIADLEKRTVLRIPTTKVWLCAIPKPAPARGNPVTIFQGGLENTDDMKNSPPAWLYKDIPTSDRDDACQVTSHHPRVDKAKAKNVRYPCTTLRSSASKL